MIERAASLAKQVLDQAVRNDGTIQTVVQRIEVSKPAITINLDLNGISAILHRDTDAIPDEGEWGIASQIIAKGEFLRCGKQVRLVLGNDNYGYHNLDARLIQEVVRAHRWFDDLVNGQVRSIAELARRSQIDVAYVSRRITLAFLSPRILESILTGTQPLTLTVERLGKACPRQPRGKSNKPFCSRNGQIQLYNF